MPVPANFMMLCWRKLAQNAFMEPTSWDGEGKPLIVVNTPYNGEDASIGNGSMVAILVPGRETVDSLHTLALKLGGTDDGPPGPRGDTFYGAYIRDLDGNKLNFNC